MPGSCECSDEPLRSISVKVEGSLPYLQEPTTFSCRGPDQSIATPILFILPQF